VAAPIRSGTGQVIAAISVSGPDVLVAPDKDDANARLVCGIAGELSRRLGFVPVEPATPQAADTPVIPSDRRHPDGEADHPGRSHPPRLQPSR
jgi:hypothetical protein